MVEIFARRNLGAVSARARKASTLSLANLRRSMVKSWLGLDIPRVSREARTMGARKPTRIRVAYDLKVGMRQDEQTGLHIAFCPALDLFAQGTTEDQAKDSIKSAISLYLVTCYERGVLDRQLRLRGAKPVPPGRETEGPAGGDVASADLERYPIKLDVHVPIDLLIAKRLGGESGSWSQ
jgi:hypothetical protein